ncbi:MAG: sodium:proton antiporter NhaD [Flavobacteriales bacterium]|nr:sodium:proton antiporter NhaD [Flavobacteriales bacterium]MCB9363541.1 sodium:proton antiporter NhaD [Flavobacteriales bacterium]
MYITIGIMFVLGYVAIALEHPIKIDKAASALFTAVICWVLLILGKTEIFPELGEEAVHFIGEDLMHHLSEIAGILFFLLGAMTIVELVDTHGGFSLITDKITTLKKSKLLIILSVVTFFMSAALDNLTTAIVMATLLRKLISNKKDLWLFAGIVIIAANAGGAWSPIGDVTTIMLWIGGQVTAANIVSKLVLPSMVCLAVPLIIMVFRMKGNVETPSEDEDDGHKLEIPLKEKKLVLYLGLSALLFVPIFKTLTHLPPFMGVLLGLSVLWATTELLHKKKDVEKKKKLSIGAVLEKVDTTSILFFLGILLAVSALQTGGHLGQLASLLQSSIGDIWIINILIGFLSSVVDNVPLVAGSIGMYDLTMFPQDHTFWELLAYCAGTGGSCLIIGSAAGVAIMGILKIDFIWYLKNITLLATLGYLSGVLTFWLLNMMI